MNSLGPYVWSLQWSGGGDDDGKGASKDAGRTKTSSQSPVCHQHTLGQVNFRAAHDGESVPDYEVSHSMLQLDQ